MDPKKDSLILNIINSEDQKSNGLSLPCPQESTNAGEIVIKSELQDYQIVNEESFSNTTGLNGLTDRNEIGFNNLQIKSENPHLDVSEELSCDESQLLKSSDIDL